MYLIDGNNLIGHTKALSLKDPQARQKLLDRIIPFLNHRGRRATVVFDGIAEPLRKGRCIQLIFAGPHSTADDQIREILENTHSPKSIHVVSSDNSVYGYAKNCGAQAMKCHEFNRLLYEDTTLDKGDEDREMKVDDVSEWLRYFGEEK